MTFKFEGERADEARDACVDMMGEFQDFMSDAVKILDEEKMRGGDHLLCYIRVLDEFQKHIPSWCDELLRRLEKLDPDLIRQIWLYRMTEAINRQSSTNELQELLDLVKKLKDEIESNHIIHNDDPRAPGYL